MTVSASRHRQPLLFVFATSMLVVVAGCTVADTSEISTESTSSVVVTTSVAVNDATSTTQFTAPTTTEPTASTTTQVPPKSDVGQSTLALSLLEGITQENEYSSGYSRDFFRHWIDADRNSCNTREEVLIAESLTNAQVDRFGCKVIAGDWFSEFDGLTHTDPSDLDIDHLVPLKEAWDSGAFAWTPAQREQFANDLSDGRALIAVTNSVNRSKGDRDPSQWLPARAAFICEYISDWIAVKWQWKLSMDASEWGRLKNLLTGQCQGSVIAPWGSVK